MNINLQSDFAKVYEYLLHRISNYNSLLNKTPDDSGKMISLITLGYEFEQSGWVALVFDTRDSAKPDGEWTSCIEENCLDMEHWCSCAEKAYEEGRSLIVELLDGSTKEIVLSDAEGEFDCLGEMLKEVLFKAKEEGLFLGLPLAKPCLMSLEEYSGSFGLPCYEKIEIEGIVN